MTAGDSLYNIVTTAVWESESAFENAKKTAMVEFQKDRLQPTRDHDEAQGGDR